MEHQQTGFITSSYERRLAVGIALMGAIVTARWPGGLAGAATDPRAFVDGLSIAFLVNAAISLLGATVAAITIAGGRAGRARRTDRDALGSRGDQRATAEGAASAS